MHHSRRRARRALAVSIAVAALVPSTASAAGLTVTTSPADPTLLSDTYALISGVLNPGGSAASYQFEWGLTTAYGETTPVTSAGNGKADVPVDYSLDALKPRTTYHYRLVAAPTDNPAARVVGADQTCRTSRSLAVSVVGRKAKATKNGRATFSLKVVGPPETAATGLLTVKAVIGKQSQTVAVRQYSIDTGKTKQISVHLPASVRSVLATKGHPKVVLRVRVKTSGIKRPVVKNLKVVA